MQEPGVELVCMSDILNCFAGEVFLVCRGTWFYDGAWTPLEESLAEKLEVEHLLHFRGHPLNVPGLNDAQKQGRKFECFISISYYGIIFANFASLLS